MSKSDEDSSELDEAAVHQQAPDSSTAVLLQLTPLVSRVCQPDPCSLAPGDFDHNWPGVYNNILVSVTEEKTVSSLVEAVIQRFCKDRADISVSQQTLQIVAHKLQENAGYAIHPHAKLARVNIGCALLAVWGVS